MASKPSRPTEILLILLKPLVRLCVGQGVSAYDFMEAVKGAYIDYARNEIEGGGHKLTTSRIAMMTGVDRREVNRFLEGKKTAEYGPSIVTRIVNQWEQDGRFLTKSRRPKVLGYKGENSEFKRLVAIISQDMNPATALFELERLGLARQTDDGIALTSAQNLWEGAPHRKVGVLTRDIELLVNSVEENTFAPRDPKNLHIRTEYDNINHEKVPLIRRWLVREGARFHRRVRNFLSKYDLDINPVEGKAGGAKVAITAVSWTSDADIKPERKPAGADSKRKMLLGHFAKH